MIEPVNLTFINKLINGKTTVQETPTSITDRFALSLGLFRDVVIFNQAGHRQAITSETELWGGPTARTVRSDTPDALTAVSSDAADNPAGAGAASCLVEYIDDDGWERFGIVVLNGITSVPVTQAWINPDTQSIEPLPGSPQASGIRVNRAVITSLGSGAPGLFDDANIGDVDVSIGANIQSRVETSHNFSSSSYVYIPRGRIGVLAGLGIGASEGLNTNTIVYTKPKGAPRVINAEFGVAAQSLPISFSLPVRIGTEVDFVYTVQRTSGTPIDAGGTFQMLLLPNVNDADPNPELQPPRLG